MPLLIKVEDFNGEVIAEFNDKKGLLNSVLDFCYLNQSKIKTFKYIDLYDDTTLNGLQVKDLFYDIDFLKQQPELSDSERIEMLNNIAEFCNVTLKEPHQYLKFYGD
jgi:hypothetical protein